MDNKYAKTAVAAAFIAALVWAGVASANPPHFPNLITNGSEWTLSGYDDSAPTHTFLATHRICFTFLGNVGTHMRYRWSSSTLPGWDGIATQEGDQVMMHGDYKENFVHDAMIWEIATNDKYNFGTGHWVEWYEDAGTGKTMKFANVYMKRIAGSVCDVVKEMSGNLSLNTVPDAEPHDYPMAPSNGVDQ